MLLVAPHLFQYYVGERGASNTRMSLMTRKSTRGSDLGKARPARLFDSYAIRAAGGSLLSGGGLSLGNLPELRLHELQDSLLDFGWPVVGQNALQRRREFLLRGLSRRPR